MIKTPLSTVLGGAFWTPKATILGSASKTFDLIIKSLFANSEQGFAYDPNDLSTMFQDVAGTVPVTGAGQPVGLIRDKSGRNNHAVQTTSASRPILRQNATTGAYYLEFDGTDDFLVTSSIDFTATDKVSLLVGMRKLSTVPGVVYELSANLSNNNGAFYLASPSGVSQPNQVTFVNKGTVLSAVGNANLAPPLSLTVTCKGDISSDITYMKTGSTVFPSSTDLGTGNYGNYPLYIGRRGGTSLPFNGHIYSLIGIGRLTTDSEIAAIEKELAKRAGVTLSV